MRSHRPLKYMKFDHRSLELLMNMNGQWLSGKHATILMNLDPQTRSIQDVIVLGAHGDVIAPTLTQKEESEGK